MLTMADSPTSVTGTMAASAQQGSSCTSPKDPVASAGAGVKREAGSPKSPKMMRRACNKANRQRNAPYPDRSPGGSTCTSSDESNGEYENEETVIQKKIKRIAANKRERKRMHTVNSAFDQLRELVPTYPSNRKLSKIDTLRLACTYIQDLVSLLHNTHAIQGEDVQLQLYPTPMSDGYMQLNGGYHVKSEMSEFSAFSPYRIPQSCITTDPSSTDYSTSESDNHSPPYFPTHSCQPTGLATRPPPLTRTNSDSSVAVYARMSPPVSVQQSTCPVSGSNMCQSQRQVNIPSPLATHSVQHTITPPLLTNGVASSHPPPPTWQRTGSVPAAYTLYTQ